MDITQKTVEETAALLNITLESHEIDELTERFRTLIDYFSVLDSIKLDIEDETLSVDNNIANMRDGTVHSFDNTHDLIECSEEHEDNYVLVPNLL